MALKEPKRKKQKYGRNIPQPSSAGANARPMRRSRQATVNLALLAITAASGVVLWILGSILYSSMADSASRPVLIGLMFGGLCAVLCTVILVYGVIAGTFEQNLITGSSGIFSTALILLGASVIVFLAGLLFQWIYGLNIGNQDQMPTSFVFVIDDSGSMAENDPDQERYKAIADVLEDMPDSFPYMVYGFSDDAYIVQEMLPKSAGVPEIAGRSSGMTEIKTALTRVMEDYQNGVWDGGDSPKVIMLTDGYATDVNLFSPIRGVLRDFASEHISISTVGLGVVDADLMKQIAEKTGGVFIDVAKASALSGAIDAAAKEFAGRDLLSSRYVPSLDFLYGFLRVLFLLILGTAIGFAAAVAYGVQESLSLTMAATLGKALFGALLMEIGTALGASAGFMWLLLWILLAATVAMKIVGIRHSTSRRLQ